MSEEELAKARERGRINGLQWRAKNRELCNERNRIGNKKAYHAADGRRKGAIKNANLKKNFGITLADYEAMHAAQGGLCAICKQPERIRQKYGLKRLAVDHDHVTGKVRGLLCQRCNQMIGHGADDVELLRKAIEYLQPPS